MLSPLLLGVAALALALVAVWTLRRSHYGWEPVVAMRTAVTGPVAGPTRLDLGAAGAAMDLTMVYSGSFQGLMLPLRVEHQEIQAVVDTGSSLVMVNHAGCDACRGGKVRVDAGGAEGAAPGARSTVQFASLRAEGFDHAARVELPGGVVAEPVRVFVATSVRGTQGNILGVAPGGRDSLAERLWQGLGSPRAMLFEISDRDDYAGSRMVVPRAPVDWLDAPVPPARLLRLPHTQGVPVLGVVDVVLRDPSGRRIRPPPGTRLPEVALLDTGAVESYWSEPCAGYADVISDDTSVEFVIQSALFGAPSLRLVWDSGTRRGTDWNRGHRGVDALFGDTPGVLVGLVHLRGHAFLLDYDRQHVLFR